MAQSLIDLLHRMRTEYDGCAPPATEAEFELLAAHFGLPPPDVVTCYREFNGSTVFPMRGSRRLPVGLIPISEAIGYKLDSDVPQLGNILWLFKDSQSNLVGIYLDGICAGWLTKYVFDEPMLTPAYRSIQSFLTQLFRHAGELDLVPIVTDVPVASDDSGLAERDRETALQLRDASKTAADERQQQLLALASIALTPASDSDALLEFVAIPNMYVQEAAIRVLMNRKYQGGVAELSRVIENGGNNGALAACTMLARMGTPEAESAIESLHKTLNADRLIMLAEAEHAAKHTR